ncbi:hypothetical protein SUGI_0190160 [Cryptomeria japonica]|nr:hypothetical protein SUGI_0190160 [Cryptomeria japonica]
MSVYVKTPARSRVLCFAMSPVAFASYFYLPMTNGCFRSGSPHITDGLCHPGSKGSVNGGVISFSEVLSLGTRARGASSPTHKIPRTLPKCRPALQYEALGFSQGQAPNPHSSSMDSFGNNIPHGSAIFVNHSTVYLKFVWMIWPVIGRVPTLCHSSQQLKTTSDLSHDGPKRNIGSNVQCSVTPSSLPMGSHVVSNVAEPTMILLVGDSFARFYTTTNSELLTSLTAIRLEACPKETRVSRLDMDWTEVKRKKSSVISPKHQMTLRSTGKEKLSQEKF